MDYEHTQGGPLPLIVTGFFAVIAAITFFFADDDPEALVGILGAMVVIVTVVYAFSRLTVVVGPSELTARFTWGWPNRVISLADLSSYCQVRNKWWYGLGVRLAPNGAWIFNVWGLDAVELELDSGKKFRIGTDEPDRLIAAIALNKRPG